MFSSRTFSLVGLVLLCLWTASQAADEKPLKIKAEDARQHVGKNVEVEFEVKASKNATKRKTVFLDSESDFNSEKNLGIAISEQGVADLKQKRGVNDPANDYLNKKIRVTGTVVTEEDRTYIKVDRADQLDLAKP